MKNVAFIGIETPIVFGILQNTMWGYIRETLEYKFNISNKTDKSSRGLVAQAI